MTRATKEPQYNRCLALQEQYGLASLGLMTNLGWIDDPRHLVFVLSRYKFIAKMLSGKTSVLEVGCADAFGTHLVLQEVPRVTAIDFDPIFIEDVRKRMPPYRQFETRVHDMLLGPVEGTFDGAYALDVIEHIPKANEETFIKNIARSLTPTGVAIIGSPSLDSQRYASEGSKEGHINCKTAPELKAGLLKYFGNVFVFSMNDEVVHTGFYPMANYYLALCTNKLE